MISRIARELGKFMWEVERDCPLEEFDDWIVIFQIEREEQKKEADKAKSKGKTTFRR